MRKVFIIVSLLFAFLLGACSTVNVNADQNYPISIQGESKNGPYRVIIIVDEETGVNYIVAAINHGGKLRGIGITPRYNSDGSFYTSK